MFDGVKCYGENSEARKGVSDDSGEGYTLNRVVREGLAEKEALKMDGDRG
jgi:hypothetical protein